MSKHYARLSLGSAKAKLASLWIGDENDINVIQGVLEDLVEAIEELTEEDED